MTEVRAITKKQADLFTGIEVYDNGKDYNPQKTKKEFNKLWNSLPKVGGTCEWKHMQSCGLYHTGCGRVWETLIDSMKFCPFCGLEIKEVK